MSSIQKKKEIAIEWKPQVKIHKTPWENFKVQMERVIQPCWRWVMVPALLVRANQTLVLGVGELQMHS